MYVKIANYLHFYYVFSKILHIEYLKKTYNLIKIHSYMFQSSCDHLQGVFLKTCFLKEAAKIYTCS